MYRKIEEFFINTDRQWVRWRKWVVKEMTTEKNYEEAGPYLRKNSDPKWKPKDTLNLPPKR